MTIIVAISPLTTCLSQMALVAKVGISGIYIAYDIIIIFHSQGI